MSVYVDDMRAPVGRMRMVHMLADTTAELLAMADTIGLPHRWLQGAGTHKEHFDLSLTKRALAVEAGAVEITWKEAGALVGRRRRLLLEGVPDVHL